MNDDHNAQAPAPVDEHIEQAVAAPGDDEPPVSGDGEVANRSGLACLGLIALIPEQTPAALWAITDLAERARALAEMVPLSCEDPEWVKLIRSVRVVAAGEIGASIQGRIGSEGFWEKGRKRWKQSIKQARESLDEQTIDFGRFSMLYNRSAAEGRLFITKEQFYEKSLDDWLWDFDHAIDEKLSVADIERSKAEAIRSGRAWSAAIEAEEFLLKRLAIDFKVDGDHLHAYKQINLFNSIVGRSKITRAEFWSGRVRIFSTMDPRIYSILMEEPALTSAEE